MISKVVVLEVRVGDDSGSREKPESDGPAEQVKPKVVSVHLCCKQYFLPTYYLLLWSVQEGQFFPPLK